MARQPDEISDLALVQELLFAPKGRIDLYAWFDVRTRRVQGVVFSGASGEHVRTLCDLLGMDASKIKH